MIGTFMVGFFFNHTCCIFISCELIDLFYVVLHNYNTVILNDEANDYFHSL